MPRLARVRYSQRCSQGGSSDAASGYCSLYSSNLLLYHDDDHDVEEDEAAESEAIVQRGHGVEKHRG